MDEENQHKYHKSQTPHFFKIILNETLQSGKLSFPKSFVQHHGRSLSLSKVYLKVPTGDVWEVELSEEEDGYLWLLNGWKDFVEFYNIKFGHFLVFGYQGNSEFEVLIFNKTASEIKYPCKPKRSNQEHNGDVDPCSFSVKPEIEETDAAETLVDHNASKSNKRKRNADCMGKGSRGYDYAGDNLGTTSKRLRPNKTRENSEAFIRSTAFDSPNPYFRIIMQSTYVTGRRFLWLPARFIMDHIGRKEFYPKLSVPYGRIWTVKCRFQMRNNHPEAIIQKGWRRFVNDNRLAIGDVCIFELIDNVDVHFQVTIFRAAKDPSFPPCPAEMESRECSGRRISPKPPRHEGPASSGIRSAAKRNHASENPSFKIAMTEARMRRGGAPIQTEFLKHLKKGAHFVTLEVAGRVWRVKVCYYRRRIRYGREGIFSLGWTNFVRENSLQAGDVCIFELVDRKEMVLKVSVHKANT